MKGPIYKNVTAAMMNGMAVQSNLVPNVVVPSNTSDFRWGHFDHSGGEVVEYDPAKLEKKVARKRQRQARRANRK